MKTEYPSNQKVRIMMIAQGPDGHVEIAKEFDHETDWKKIAGMFYQFLAGMSYSLSPTDVSADWE